MQNSLLNQNFDLQYFQQHEHTADNPLLGLGEGDCALYLNVLDDQDAENIFNDLKEEIQWGRMFNQEKAVQRLVAIQGTIDEHPQSKKEREPLYRHPADEQPKLHNWTPNVNKIREAVEQKVLEGKQPLNHCLIQLYRSGKDLISEHADKTLDIERYSKIINYSSGATRVMSLRTKKPVKKEGEKNIYRIQRISLPHNSVFILGWKTNRLWKHTIKQDKRIPSIKSPDELRDNCQRISLTFRHVSSFYRSSSDGRIYGQGAKYKTEEELDKAIENNTFQEDDVEQESLRLLKAFSAENHSSEFDWDEYYGNGFNILNFKVLNPL